MIRRILLVLSLALGGPIAPAGAQPEIAPKGSPPTSPPPGMSADTIVVQKLGHHPIPHCPGEGTDSLRFTHCYPILEEGLVRRWDWFKDLSRILGSRMVSWDHDSCGYEPQAIVRFVSPGPSELVVFTSRCDSSRVGLLKIRPGVPMEYAELGLGGPFLLGLLAEVLPINGIEVRTDRAPGDPTEGEFVYYEEEPTPVTKTDPVPSAFAKDAQITGKVILHALVGADGRLHQVKIIKGIVGLNDSAVECVKQWVWKPARSNGKPVAVWVEIPLDFH
jgi:protein TonB